MGKKQHQKDKLYITTTEWSSIYGGKKRDDSNRSKFRRLPFNCCSLSLKPFNLPCCTLSGTIFDFMTIICFLKNQKINPVTGEKLRASELIKLTFHKNNDGEMHCPILCKVFTETSHIVAIKTSGNIYSYEAVEKLNIRENNFHDLLTNDEFTRPDIIHLQDPSNLEKHNFVNFFHIRTNLTNYAADIDPEFSHEEVQKNIRKLNTVTQAVMEELDEKFKVQSAEEQKPKPEPPKADFLNKTNFTTGKMAASFTSTAVDVETSQEIVLIDEQELLYRTLKKDSKGYLSLSTNYGDLNFELYCDLFPQACHNFILLCQNGYYNGSIFHRIIPNFVAQGGDPNNDGGQSAFGRPFRDEFRSLVKHDRRGMLSMANAEKDNNKSQFFVTFKCLEYLDGRHTVFGRLVGGGGVLDRIEQVKTDEDGCPLQPVRIDKCSVFVDPYLDAQEEIRKKREDFNKEPKQSTKNRTEDAPNPNHDVGKYVQKKPLKRETEDCLSEYLSKRKILNDLSTSTFSTW